MTLYGFDDAIVWDENGKILVDDPSCTLWDGSKIHNLRFKGNAALMHMAQLVFRKNRRRMKYAEPEGNLDVQSVEEINKQLTLSPDALFSVTLFAGKIWGSWEFPITWGQKGSLLAKFPMVDIHGDVVKDIDGKDVMIIPFDPLNNRDEFNQLEYYRRYTIYRYNNSSPEWQNKYKWTRWFLSELD